MPGEAPELAGQERPAGAAPAQPGQAARPGTAARRWAFWGLFALAGVLLWFAFFRVSGTQPVNSEGSSEALQAWDMLHGNINLHGWWLGDVSFYTTELPEWMLVEAVRGLNPNVIHIAAALTYTLLVLTAALLARGQATGRQAVIRMLVAAGILLAPQLGVGTYVLLMDPDHVGSAVAVIVILLVLGRAPRRWWVPVVIGVALAWVLVADTIVVYTAVIPLVVAGGVRIFQEVAVRRRPLSQVWFESAVAGAAAVAVPVGLLASAAIHTGGGYFAWPESPALTPVAKLPGNLRQGYDGIALLFGFSTVHSGIGVALALLHLVGLALAVCAVALGVCRFLRETSLVTRALTVAVLLNFVAYVASTTPNGPETAREMAAILPFATVLAGRLLADRLGPRTLGPVLAVALLGYSLALAYDAAQPTVAPENSQLTSWLEGHHLAYGLGGYWYSTVETVTSGNQVQVRPVCYGRNGFSTDRWETQTSWYDPGQHRADFLVMAPSGGYGGLHSPADGGFAGCYAPTYSQVVAAFGRPAHSYRVGPDTVLVWNQNLLSKLG